MLHLVVAGIIGAASVVAAFGILSKFFGIGEMWTGTRNFLKDWNGEPARPGFAGRPSFPERMTAQEQQAEKIEKRTADLNHDMRGEIASRLILLEDATKQLRRNGGTHLADVVHDIAEDVRELKATTQANGAAMERANQRITEHRRRQEETIVSLRAYLTERLNAMEISHAQFDAMRASLHELGIDVQPPEAPRA